MTKELKRFEQWWDAEDDIPNDGPYTPDTPIQFAWAGWQAALAQPKQDTIQRLSALVRAQQITIDKLEAQHTEQEPVAHCEAGPEYCPVCNKELNPEPAIYPREAYEMGLEEIAFYTTPPQRTWVGLTDEERDEICLGDESVARSIEAKLREKNGGNHES